MLAQIRDHRSQAFFRFRRVAGKVVVTNQQGSYLVLTPDEFTAFAEGRAQGELQERLHKGQFLRQGFDVERAAEHLSRRKQFIHHGPNLHIVVVTLRCNETCVYCHASRADLDATHTDMTPELAEKTVDRILKTTTPTSPSSSRAASRWSTSRWCATSSSTPSKRTAPPASGSSSPWCPTCR